MYHLYSSARGRVIERIGIVHFMSINRLNGIKKGWWEDLHERNIKVNDFNLARNAQKDRKEGGVVLFVKKKTFSSTESTTILKLIVKLWVNFLSYKEDNSSCLEGMG